MARTKRENAANKTIGCAVSEAFFGEFDQFAKYLGKTRSAAARICLEEMVRRAKSRGHIRSEEDEEEDIQD